MSNITALNAYLEPFQPFFEISGVTEICINKPYEMWVEREGHFSFYEMPAFSMNYLLQFARLVAEYNQREISPEYPTLSSTLPDGSRVQFVIEPACQKESFICSIRRQAVMQLSLESYFDPTEELALHFSLLNPRPHAEELRLMRYYQERNYIAFLKLAVLLKKNIIISGGTSTGKTTALNSLLQTVPLNERIVTIETDREVKSHHPNTVHLLAAQEGRSVAEITMLDLLKAALRLRPDRLLISELRAEEAFAYLRAVNSGHPGSLTTLHADSPIGCFEQLVFMAMQSHSHFNRADILAYAKSAINIVVQIRRGESDKRFISAIYFDQADKPESQPARLFPKCDVPLAARPAITPAT
jgi:type IV secretion system protein VirB11